MKTNDLTILVPTRNRKLVKENLLKFIKTTIIRIFISLFDNNSEKST